jgi:hypothetical protein
MSGEEIAILAERTARELLDVSLEEALRMLDAGELAGTSAELSMRGLRVLLTAE